MISGWQTRLSGRADMMLAGVEVFRITHHGLLPVALVA
jgi:hypothetical protein